MAGKGDAAFNSFIKSLSHLNGGQEASNAGITTSVSINDFGAVDSRDSNGLDFALTFAIRDGNDNWLSTLGDDRDTVTLGVCFFVVSHVFGSGFTVFRLESLLLSKSAGLIFVAEGVIGVLNGIHNFIEVSEEEERSSDVESHRLVVLSAVASNLAHGLNVRGDEESGDVNHLGGFQIAHVSIEMRSRVFARSGKVSAEGTLFSDDDTSARSSGGLGIYRHDGFHVELGAALYNDFTIVIVSNASQVANTS